MDRTNFSLLAVLYDRANTNLYSEIYFPLIKYVLRKGMGQDKSSDGYTRIDSLKDVIRDLSSISIPTTVLQEAIVRIGAKDSDLTVYEKGASFKISPTWESDLNQDIDEKASALDSDLTLIENEFQKFLTAEDLECKYTFREFFSGHTSSLLGYLQSGDTLESDSAEFTNLVRFIEILRDQSPRLYQVAEEFFWSSIIAAFLQRDQAKLTPQGDSSVNFYFDTSLVLSLLGLSLEENSIHARELKELIEKSGHRVCVHQMTLWECETILEQIADNGGPDPNSQIFDVYVSKGMTPTIISKISCELSTKLSAEGVILDHISKQEVKNHIRKYHGSHLVKELQALRRGKPDNYDYREVHDIFMAYFVKEKRNVKICSNTGLEEKYYFVTLNDQLIKFVDRWRRERPSLMIHPQSIVANLWLNGALSRGMARGALSETIARCLAANNTDTRSRMRAVVKYSREYIEDEAQRTEFCRKAYKTIKRRSNKVLQTVDDAKKAWENETPENSHVCKEKFGLLMIAVNAADEMHSASNYELVQRLEKIESDSESIRQQLQTSQNDSVEKDRQLQEAKRIADEQKASHEKNMEELAKISTEISKIDENIKEYESSRESSVSDKRYYVYVSLEFLFMLIMIAGLSYFYMMFNGGSVLSLGIGIVSAVIGLGGFILGRSWWQYDKRESMRNEQRKRWQDANPRYGELLRERDRLKCRQDAILKGRV